MYFFIRTSEKQLHIQNTPKEVIDVGFGGNQVDARIKAENQLRAAKDSNANPKDIAKLQAAYDAAKYAENRAKGKS